VRKHSKSIKSRFTTLENQFLNTFFSGVYVSASEFISIGKKVDLNLGMNTRELLIKELLNKSDENGTLNQTVALLNDTLQERITKYNSLSKDYPGSTEVLARLAKKTKNTASLLATSSRGNPSE